MTVNAYLNFSGNCREALEFYADLLGGQVLMMITHADAPPEMAGAPDWKDKIMHGRISVDGSLIMGSDAPPQYAEKPQGFSVSLSIDDAARGKQIFEALAEGGQVGMPFQKTFWAEGFGMVTDRFGTPWMVNAGMTPF